MAKRRKQTAIQRAYNTEYNRVKRATRRLIEQGIQFDEIPYPKKLTRPTKKSVEKLQQIRPEDIARKGYVETPDGIISGEEYRARLRRESARKSAQTRKRRKAQPTKPSQPTQPPVPNYSDIIISNFLYALDNFPTLAKPLFQKWLNNLLTQYSRDDVANMLQEGMEAGLFPDNKEAYSMEALTGIMTEFMQFLGVPESMQDEINQATMMGEEWNQEYDIE